MENLLEDEFEFKQLSPPVDINLILGLTCNVFEIRNSAAFKDKLITTRFGVYRFSRNKYNNYFNFTSKNKTPLHLESFSSKELLNLNNKIRQIVPLTPMHKEALNILEEIVSNLIRKY